jgi:uncharacterized protein YndB with AHSA1/START domain
LIRVFNAPRELVFDAWIDPAKMAKWWGPSGFTNPVCELDARPGGAIRIDMCAPDGTVYPMAGTFQEVIAPEKLVMLCVAHQSADGEAQLHVVNTAIFEDVDGKTRLTVHSRVTKAGTQVAQAIAGMDIGWSQSLVRLEELVSIG